MSVPLMRPIQAYYVGSDTFLMDSNSNSNVHMSIRQTQRGLLMLIGYPDGTSVLALFNGVLYAADYKTPCPPTSQARWDLTEQFLQDIQTVVPE